jgi:hypothetical protein
VYRSTSTIFTLLHVLQSPSLLHKYPHPPIGPILQSCPSFFIPKSVFKRVSRCSSAVTILYFGQFNLLCYSPSPFPPTLYYSTAFTTYRCVFYLHRCYVFPYCCLSFFFGYSFIYVIIRVMSPSYWTVISMEAGKRSVCFTTVVLASSMVPGA